MVAAPVWELIMWTINRAYVSEAKALATESTDHLNPQADAAYVAPEKQALARRQSNQSLGLAGSIRRNRIYRLRA